MDALREFLKGWAGKGLLILFLLPLAITGFESIVRSGDDPNAVAKVGDLNIDGSILQNTINERRTALLEQVKGDASLIDDEALRKQSLQNMIDRYLLMYQGKQLGFTVSDATITQMLMSEQAFLGADGKFSNDAFANFLKGRGMTKDQLFDSLRQDLAVQAFSRSIINTGLFSEAGIEKLINAQNESRPVWLYRFDWQQFAPQVQVSDSEINQYYQKNQADLKSAEMVDVNYMQLDKNQLPVTAPTEQEIAQQYQMYLKNQGSQTEYEVAMILMSDPKAQATLTGLKQQLDNNQADFGTLAKQYSQDEVSKNEGGNIGPISEGMFPEHYQQILTAVKALKVGQVTAPIKTNFGYHLFKLVKINGQTPPSLDSVKPTLIEQLTTQKREALYQDTITKINNDAVAGANLGELANRYKLTAQSLKNYPKVDNTTVLNQPAIITKAFDPLGVQEGSMSVGIELANKVVWLQSTNHRAVKNLTQAEAVPVIKAKLTQQKAQALALAQAQALASKIQQANSVDNVGVPLQSLGMVNRQHPALLTEERGSAFSLPANNGKLAVTTATTTQGASVLVGGAITATNPISAEEKQSTAKVIRDAMGQSQFEDYLAYLRSVIEVKIKPQTPTN
ncbi:MULTISPECIES: SurA N-terminal domain-containing protein [unclassified Moraxella]|uniref:SurA N-terminal domain-containing protein n=1 Tax=unclassified Moraxella TaxID=2685852 RepID=UPI003AF5F907